MVRPAVTSLFACIALLVIASAAQGQQFNPEYFPLDTIWPAIQVDLNGDGVPDFIAQEHSYQMDELLSTGPGSYTTHTFYIAGSGGGYPIASGDFNNDGKADVILFGPLEIAYGDGSGGFSSVKSISWSGSNQQFDYAAAQLADFNGDGKPDIAIAFVTTGSGPWSFQIALFINNGNGFNNGVTVYNKQVASGAAGFEYTHPLDLVLGDFDADGHADLALRTVAQDPNNPANADTTITVFFGNGAGKFTPVTVNTSNDLFQISAADLNNDGTSDIVAMEFGSVDPSAIFYGHPGRTFSRVNIPAHKGADNMNPMLADFNGDHLKDIVYAEVPYPENYAGVSTLLQTSAGTFKPLAFESIDTYVGGHGLVPFSQTFVGDYNRDGKPDVMLVSSSTQQHPNNAEVLLNTRSKANGTCQAPAPVGIAVCSPKPNQTVSNPVQFAFSSTSFYPVRKMEVWIDGKKRSETYEVFANEGFANVKLTLTAGSHEVSLFEGGFDGTVQHTSYNITVK